MALIQNYKGITQESTEQGISTQITMIGTQTECITALNAAQYGVKDPTYGYLKSVQMQQDNGKFYTLTYKYSTSTASSASPPVSDTAYGEKSATLTCGLMQLPLEKRPNYLTCWNHYLFGASGAATPAWHATATNTNSATAGYAWGKYLSDKPDGMAVLQEPAKPGVQHYDVATYQITETAKFRTNTQAGTFVANKLNKISAPDTTFGITGGNWKCDSASVSWRNKAWYATLTYTRSGDDSGWDTDLYD